MGRIIFPSPSGPLREGCHIYTLPPCGDDDDDDYDHDFSLDMMMRKKKMIAMILSGPLGEGCHTYILPFRGDDDDDDYGDVQMINDHDYIGDMRMKKMFTMMSFGKAVT